MRQSGVIIRRCYPPKPGLYICLFVVPIKKHFKREIEEYQKSGGRPTFTYLASNASFPSRPIIAGPVPKRPILAGPFGGPLPSVPMHPGPLPSGSSSAVENVAPILIGPASESMPHESVSADAIPIPADFPMTCCAMWDEVVQRWRQLFYWERSRERDFGNSVEKFLGIHGFLLTDRHGSGSHCLCPHQSLVRRLSTDAGHDIPAVRRLRSLQGTKEVRLHLVSYSYFSKYFNSFGFDHMEPFEEEDDREAVARGEIMGLTHGVRHGCQMTLVELNFGPDPHIQETQSDSWTAVLRSAKNQGRMNLFSHCEQMNMLCILHCIPRLQNVVADGPFREVAWLCC